MPDITIKGTLREPGGKAAEGRKIAFLCDTQMLGDAFVDAVTKEAVSDREGKFQVTFPQGVNVQIMLPGGQRVAVTLPEKSSIDFDELLKSAK
ncbi:MAG TPA: hypothetical protein VKV28_04225 [Candidatus Binataceae bacterium]|nr:hypothetical protein [Candidatus Binataceae bacterium]